MPGVFVKQAFYFFSDDDVSHFFGNKILESKTGPSLQQRNFPSVVSIVQPKQQPTPHAMCDSILSQHCMPHASATCFTYLSIGVGPQAYTAL